jgi:hypothetical protein
MRSTSASRPSSRVSDASGLADVCEAGGCIGDSGGGARRAAREGHERRALGVGHRQTHPQQFGDLSGRGALASLDLADGDLRAADLPGQVGLGQVEQAAPPP